MSWVKKVWSRLFSEGAEDVEEPVREPVTAEIEHPKKAPFRFPLISDNEKDKFAKPDSVPVQPAPRRRASSPALNKARGYETPKTDSYVPREAQVVRAPKIVDAPIAHTYEAPPKRQPLSTIAPRPYRPRISDTPKLPKSRTAEPPVKKTRPFEPSRVPSPIHGYNETRPEPVMKSPVKKAFVNEQPYLSSRALEKKVSKANEKNEDFQSVSSAKSEWEENEPKTVRVTENNSAIGNDQLIKTPMSDRAAQAEKIVEKEVLIETSLTVEPESQQPSVLLFDTELLPDEETEALQSQLADFENTASTIKPPELEEATESAESEEPVESVDLMESTEAEEVEEPKELVEMDDSAALIEPAETKEATEPAEFPGAVDSPESIETAELPEIEKSKEIIKAVETTELQETDEPKELTGVAGTSRQAAPDQTVGPAELAASMEQNVSKSLGHKKEKTVPFNVLMLKSDKQRISKPTVSKQEQPAAEPKRKLEVQKQMMSDFNGSKLAEDPEPVQELQLPEREMPAVYEHPKNDLLRAPENDLIDEAWMEEQGERLIEALSHFQVQASILSIVQGPAVTQFEVTVAQGVKVSKIRNLADDLKLALAAKDIRIQAPIPGKSSIGIEIPNRTSRAVRISEVIESRVFQESDSPLEAALGLDLTGKPVTLDLRKMPHGLIAGATGSGKSVCINSLLVSLLYKSSPRDLKMLLIDPKMVELAPYNHIPHLVSPVITDVKAATASLKWAVEEMERRYQLFAHTGVRDISRYNKLVKEKGDHAQHLPYILIVIDELADLMMMSPSDVEDAICRIAQKARACGIHLVIATQRPSVDVITGLIKSNIPTRIAFSVSSQVDSRTILDSQGAERLLGRGDMLYLGNGMSAPVRIQGTFVTDDEIEDVIAHVRAQGEPEYIFKEDELIRRNDASDIQDDLFEEACRFIMSQGSASTSLLQRKFHIGYNRAARLMDLIEQHGFISEQNGSKARAVLITEEDIENVFQ